jgi:hypothetical protein
VIGLASSTTKTGRYDIAEILLKVALNTKNQLRSIIYKVPQDKIICTATVSIYLLELQNY